MIQNKIVLIFYLLALSVVFVFSFEHLQEKLEKEINIETNNFLKHNHYEDLDDYLNTGADKNPCNETNACKNGGSCLRHSCLCLPGTSGPFCETIDECKRRFDPLCDTRLEYTTCSYDIETQRAFCDCHIVEAKFDPSTRTCKDCECNLWYAKDYGAWYDCRWGPNGEKICSCTEKHAYDPTQKICSDCDCGENSKWCEFDSRGDKVCVCKDGYKLQSNGQCRECDCGEHGLCNFDGWNPPSKHSCICDPGYSQLNDTCEECDCGKHGKCLFNQSGDPYCECDLRYSEKNGKCEFCFCGDHSKCSFQGTTKVCECQYGYEDIHGFCVEMDRCQHNICGSNRNCRKSSEGYVCTCKEGYRLKVEETFLDICEDINECLDSKSCPDQNTECVNTIGSYKCVCKDGFASRGDIGSVVYCEKTPDSSIYTVMGITVAAILVISIAVVFTAKRNIDQFRDGDVYELPKTNL